MLGIQLGHPPKRGVDCIGCVPFKERQCLQVIHQSPAVVVLDTEVTDELTCEGLARDVVRHVQQARRDADLVVTDRIQLTVDGDEAVLDAIRIHEAHVAGQVLAVDIVYGHPAGSPDGEATTVTVEGAQLQFSLTVA